MKCLIVDDYEPFRALMKRVLQPFATEVGECADGREAAVRFSELRPDWVFIDLSMGQVDGLSATRAICARFPGACVVIVTGNDDPQLRSLAAQAGACGFYLKEELDDEAANGDIHTYRLTLNGSHTTALSSPPLTGSWSPDARVVDPDLVFDTSPRPTYLNDFNGLDPNGS